MSPGVASLSMTTSSSMPMSIVTTGMSTSAMMTFSHGNTMLSVFSTAFSPKTTGQYVGTWFFAFFLAFLWKALQFAMVKLDQYWARKYVSRSVIVKGGYQAVTGSQVILAWRASVNIPRACLAFLAQGIAYLLMIIVMILNVGLFFAVLVGILVGELAFGRVLAHGTGSIGC